MTDHSEKKSNLSVFSVPEAFSINSELLLWKFNFMGDGDADGKLVSGQLELCYFSNKSVSKWHTICPSALWDHVLLRLLLSHTKLGLPTQQSTDPAWHFACVPVSLSAAMNYSWSECAAARLCDPWTITHIYYYNISSVSCKSRPFVQRCALRNPPLFYFIQAAQRFFHLTKSDKMTQAYELSICTFASTTMREQFESRNEIQSHHATDTVIWVPLFHNSGFKHLNLIQIQ